MKAGALRLRDVRASGGIRRARKTTLTIALGAMEASHEASSDVNRIVGSGVAEEHFGQRVCDLLCIAGTQYGSQL
ncbi:hypothetical protein Rmf_40180 [Roseomonas fluvialis]|uniref:Uncharacterized protein n=1 Tax=Roseomonas fluvialis TaxID=1750527 RepID=A0ABN6P8X5_9PROT|nr:hypothetical protein Rmf_40180 [Roseomonas fluvialis]